MIGTSLGAYKILEPLGAGGMGEVYLAEDTRLGRKVAIKVLPEDFAVDVDRLARFEREAKLLASLNHANIATIYGLEEEGDRRFIAMELVEGETLAERIARTGRIEVDEALDIARQIAGALEAAHERGIVHRDLKPANIVLTRHGHVKVLDFGLAKATRAAGSETAPATADRTTIATEIGVVLGTAPYMSPEQAQGKPVDPRADLFSLGIILYELLTGTRPFGGDSRDAARIAIISDHPVPPSRLWPDLPVDLEKIVLHCLEKDPDDRYRSASELSGDLAALQSRLIESEVNLRSVLSRPGMVIRATAVVVVLAGLAGWFWLQSSRARWAREQALPAIERLLQEGELLAALRLARRAEAYIPDDPGLAVFERNLTIPLSVRTTPAGAEVRVKDYLSESEDWEALGPTPIDGAVVPYGHLRVEASKDGFDTAEAAIYPLFVPELELTLSESESELSDWVLVPGGRYRLGSRQPVEFDSFRLGKYEVTNQEYQEFVDAGGYRERAYWDSLEPFVKDGATLSFAEAMAEFRDRTGRPGPATWYAGRYPDGEEDFPVRGVSWYEAAAYAEFVGASLPTVYHWEKAADQSIFSDIVLVSNFGGRPGPVGSFSGLGRYGTYDMAGNVKEWCWNAAGEQRYILGGAWDEPGYMYARLDALSPFDRSEKHGFRIARYATAPSGDVLAPIEGTIDYDYTDATPVADDVFAAYLSVYSYDPTDLDESVEETEETRDWLRETVTFNAAYEGERIKAYLFLPKNATPPYQPVVYFPTSIAEVTASSEDMVTTFFDYLVRAGRAVILPVYQGTFERAAGVSSTGASGQRDVTIQRAKDLRRSVDYLESRPEIDMSKLAYVGNSLGGGWGPVFVAVEDRFSAAVLVGAGLDVHGGPPLPVVDPVNFAPRVKIPVLMLNGRWDLVGPVDASQAPLFRLLGTPEPNKRHFLSDSGHVVPMVDMIRETLDWLDLHLGPAY